MAPKKLKIPNKNRYGTTLYLNGKKTLRTRAAQSKEAYALRIEIKQKEKEADLLAKQLEAEKVALLTASSDDKTLAQELSLSSRQSREK